MKQRERSYVELKVEVLMTIPQTKVEESIIIILQV